MSEGMTNTEQHLGLYSDTRNKADFRTNWKVREPAQRQGSLVTKKTLSCPGKENKGQRTVCGEVQP